ncbi:MAG: amidohydrolase family protein [Phycisphaerales bacterium JB063]
MTYVLTRLFVCAAWLLASVCFTGPATAQDLTPTAPPQDRTIVIHSGTVHTMAGDTFAPGYIVFDAGVIIAVGAGDGYEVGEDAWLIDAEGLEVYPGLIAGPSRLGLQEIRAVRASDDYDELGGITPEVYAAVAVNPDSTLIPVARTGGILTFASSPTGGRIPGRMSVMRSEGWTAEEMTLSRDAGLVVRWPNMRPVQAWWMDQSDAEQMRERDEAIAAIDELFELATAYQQARDAGDPGQAVDLRLEAMLGVLPSAGDEQLPVFLHAHDYDQIVGAVSWAIDRGLKPVVFGGRDAPLAAGLLKEHRVPVILAGTFRFPKRADSPYDDAFTLPLRCEEAGIDWCLSHSTDPSNLRNLPFSAAQAVAFGLDAKTALEAITIDMARTLGVGDELGSLEVGKRATLIITEGNPLDIRSAILAAFVDGRNLDLTNKQTRLYELYRERYRQLGLIPEAGE